MCAWSMIDKPRVQKVTPAIARQFAEMEGAPNDRPVRPHIMNYLLDQIVNGHFRTAEWAICHCKETGKSYRVNGKHTSQLFYQLNGEVPHPVFVNITEYNADSLEDVAHLYSTFDSSKSARSPGEIYNLFLSAIPGIQQKKFCYVNAAVSGIAYAIWEENDCRHTPEEKGQLMLTHQNYMLWLYTNFNPAKDRMIWRSATIAAMFRTFQRHQKLSLEFWRAVVEASGPDNKSADRVLNQYLITHSMNHGKGAEKGGKKVGRREMHHRCLIAWNAWRKKETTNLRYHTDKPLPAVA